MKDFINRLRCRLFGHRRGKHVAGTEEVACPRCGHRRPRKARKAKAE